MLENIENISDYIKGEKIVQINNLNAILISD